MVIQFKRLTETAKLPFKATKGAACHDIYADEDVEILPGETKIVKTGFAVQLPSGFELQIRMRSGLSTKGIMLANGVGTVDEDYRNEVGVILHNANRHVAGADNVLVHDLTPFQIKKGDRIAQCAVVPVQHWVPIEVAELNVTERTGGYGSTGS